MAKSNLCKDGTEEMRQSFKVAIVTAETMRNIPRSATIKASGMSPANFYKCWKNPELFRLRDVIAIFDFLHIPEDDRKIL